VLALKKTLNPVYIIGLGYHTKHYILGIHM